MTKKSIIIIGAGLAGLSTGCYSQMNGYQTHIFEHNAMPGGGTNCKRIDPAMKLKKSELLIKFWSGLRRSIPASPHKWR